MPKGKVTKKREKQIQYFKNIDKYKEEHKGKNPPWAKKKTK